MRRRHTWKQLYEAAVFLNRYAARRIANLKARPQFYSITLTAHDSSTQHCTLSASEGRT